MSYYRDSPSKRSPYNRSPVKGLQSQRDFIQQELRLKNAYRSQAQNRRLLDQISLLQIKMRKTDQLQARCDALIKQNAIITTENDHLAKQLSQRRYQVQKIRSTSLHVQQRDNYKSTQLGQINRSLQIQIQLLKKQRIQSSKLYESHIQKLQIMLQDKIKQNQLLSLKCNDLLNQKQLSQVRFQEQKNKLKNLMSRTSYDMQRQLQYTKQKQTTQKFVQIQTLKKNYISQIGILQDQISKLKNNNNYKSSQFQVQLQQNKNLKIRYEQQIRNLINDNDNLRIRILKLQQMNKTQVQNIQQKYSNIHTKDTSSLKQQHQRQIRILLDQIDRQKWIINQKNNEIQHLIRQKRQQQNNFRDRQLALVTEIQTLKNKLNLSQTQSAELNHNLMNSINQLHNKNLRDSQNYFERVKNLQTKIKQMENQINHKQSQNQELKAISQLRIQSLENQLQLTINTLRKTTDSLKESQQNHKSDVKLHQQYRQKSQQQRRKLSNTVSQLQVSFEDQKQRSQSLKNDLSSNDQLLKIQIKSLRNTVQTLQRKLSQEEQSHSTQMNQLSTNLRDKIQKLQAMNKKLYEETKKTHEQQIQVLKRRIQKLQRQKQQMQKKLQQYIKLYNGLESYFNQPHNEAVFKEKASSSIYQVLNKTSKSTVHIF